MILCENIAYIYNIIYQKIFGHNNLNSEITTKNNSKKNSEINSEKNNKINTEKNINKIKSREEFISDYEYDNYLIENDLLCIICYYPLSNDVKKLKCHHNYHTKCLNEWKKYKKTCPICKKTII